MARDDALLDRMYGAPGPSARPPAPSRYGWGPAAWICGLLVCAAGSGLVAIGALTLGLMPTTAERELRAWGVVEPGREIWLYHDDSPARDGSSGCAAAGDELVRWEGRRPVARVPITGADVDVRLGERALVTVRRDGVTVTCPFQLGEGADDFGDALRIGASRRVERPWGPGRTDPRLR